MPCYTEFLDRVIHDVVCLWVCFHSVQFIFFQSPPRADKNTIQVLHGKENLNENMQKNFSRWTKGNFLRSVISVCRVII